MSKFEKDKRTAEAFRKMVKVLKEQSERPPMWAGRRKKEAAA